MRVKYSRATYGPAKWLMNEMFNRRVKSAETEFVIFMAGGTASGKSSCAEVIGARAPKDPEGLLMLPRKRCSLTYSYLKAQAHTLGCSRPKVKAAAPSEPMHQGRPD
ncbi:MAG: hypothetical protein P1V20_17705 [Verrucomicrobiales bacterium]|nr:hypothetical protein [Verrucomicrobiales bacterium]